MSSPAPELLPELLLANHLKALKLPTFLREHEIADGAKRRVRLV